MTLDQIIKGANERIQHIYATVKDAPKAAEVEDKFPVGLQEMLRPQVSNDKFPISRTHLDSKILHLRPFFPSSYYNEKGENYVWADDVVCRAMTFFSLRRGQQVGKQVLIGELDNHLFSRYCKNGISQNPIESVGSQWVWDKIRCFDAGMAAYSNNTEYDSILFTDIDSVICRKSERRESYEYMFQDFIWEGVNPQESYGTAFTHDHLFAAYCEMWQSMAATMETYLRGKSATLKESPILQALSELSHPDPISFYTFAYYNIPQSEFHATADFWREMVDFRNKFPELVVSNAFFVEQFFGSLFVAYRHRFHDVSVRSFGPYYYWAPREWNAMTQVDTERFVHMVGASKTDATWNRVLALWIERHYPEMMLFAQEIMT